VLFIFTHPKRTFLSGGEFSIAFAAFLWLFWTVQHQHKVKAAREP
jgi:hypothetical protein